MTDTDESLASTLDRARPRDSGDVLWEETRAGSGSTGAELIGELVKLLPKKPGVYRMMNAAGDVLYVGKAKSLKARVASYARLGGHTQRIVAMIMATLRMEFVKA